MSQRLWEWSGRDASGKTRSYQTQTPDVPESAAREHIKKHFRNLTVESITEVFEAKPATGIVEAHTFSFGIYAGVGRELGTVEADKFGIASRSLTHRKSLLEP